MYKVFLNDKRIKLIDDYADYQSDENTLFLHFSSRESLEFAIDLLTDNGSIQNLIIYSPDIKELWDIFKNQFKNLEAAGGLVRNDDGEILMILKRGKWDLPKGKIDPGENAREAALREVEEECGVKNLSVVSELPNTYHIYKEKGEKILKSTHWYGMAGNHTPPFQVDKNEGIEKAAWMAGDELDGALKNSYLLIEELICSNS